VKREFEEFEGWRARRRKSVTWSKVLEAVAIPYYFAELMVRIVPSSQMKDPC